MQQKKMVKIYIIKKQNDFKITIGDDNILRNEKYKNHTLFMLSHQIIIWRMIV